MKLMLNKLSNYINLFSLLIVTYLSFQFFHPSDTQPNSEIGDGFILENALNHVQEISSSPHFVGSKRHKKVKRYIINELQNMGLINKIKFALKK